MADANDKYKDRYKDIVKSKNLRMQILKLLSFVPDKMMIKLQYRIKCHEKLNLKNPKTLGEKINWYKLYWHDDSMHICSDKYLVRDYLKERGLERYLNELYAVYDRVEDVDFDALPDSFVMKTTNGSGTNIIVPDKSKLDIEETKKTLHHYMERPAKKSPGREWGYYGQTPRIIVEKLLVPTGQIGEGIDDYKFMCFNGEPKYIWVDTDRSGPHYRSLFDMDFNMYPCACHHPNIPKEQLEKAGKPKMLPEMIELAKTLCKDFPHVRVDMYSFEDTIVFGEMTFYSGSGYSTSHNSIDPPEYADFFGDMFTLPEPKKADSEK